MNILITAPSLNEAENVSGVSTIARTIIQHKPAHVNFFHFRIGRKDGEKKGVGWAIDQLTLVPRVASFIRKNRVEAVHLNTDFTKPSVLRDFMLLSYLKRRKHIPVLLHVHGGHMLMKPPKKGSAFGYMIRYMLKNSNINIVLSSIEQQKLKDNFGADAAILPNTVPLPALPFPARAFNGKIKFIFLGRLVREKGIYLLVDAFRALGSGYHRFSFTIYGAGPEKDQLLSQLQNIDGLDFTYAGIAKGVDKWKALAAADVFLLPSLFGEGMPIAMLEAMQSGCVPLVSDDASIGTVVKDGLNGLIVGKGDLAKLIETINRIITNQLDLQNLSGKAMETIENEYNVSAYIKKLAGYYSFLSD